MVTGVTVKLSFLNCGLYPACRFYGEYDRPNGSF